ncbi:MAG: hypothetical protein ABJH94_12695 [Paracoccaceae bacterium]
MKKPNFLKTSVALTGVACLSITLPTQSFAKQYDVCQLETVPDNILKRITKRSDFGDILQQMFLNCPESALVLTDAPTAAVSTRSQQNAERDDANQRSRIGSNASGSAGQNDGDSGSGGGSNSGGSGDNGGGGSAGGGDNGGGGNAGDGDGKGGGKGGDGKGGGKGGDGKGGGKGGDGKGGGKGGDGKGGGKGGGKNR